MLKLQERKGILLCLTTAFVSGFSIFINKFGVKGINPYVFTGVKNFLVAISLFSLILAGKEIRILKKMSSRDWLSLFSIGLVGGSIPFLLFFKGLSLTTSAQASFIHKNMFLLVAFLAPLLLKEKLEKKFFLAGFLLLAGNILLLIKTFSFSLNQGSILILIATFLWALENIISKKVLKYLPSIIVAWGRMFFGSLLIMVFLALTGKFKFLTSLKYTHWLWIFITSGLLVAYVSSWYSGLKRVRVSIATSILTLGAPITSILSLTLGKTLTFREIGGIILLFIGIILVIDIKKPSLSLRFR